MKHHAKKRFGQHFLNDQTVITHIVSAIHPTKDDALIEIGPGLGALTQAILPHTKTMHAIELDRDVIPKLEHICKDLGELRIHQADVLSVDFHALTEKRPLRIIGNLPYNISTPLLFHLIGYADSIRDMVFMVQREVAERLAAPTGGKHYGRLSVMMQYHCSCSVLFDVPPTAFSPPPKVMSSVIRIIPHKTLPSIANNKEHFEMIVREAFNHRRKTLHNSLKKFVEPDMFVQAQLDPQLRPEQVSVKQFIALSNSVTSAPGK
ncbi:MAG: ribosomal RNA small subunit methyltransferase A [marine bacterium B5-7]|nr:MAG: ribosomal RNA small subunit methyltransferase A [marine bacterium B5-7]